MLESERVTRLMHVASHADYNHGTRFSADRAKVDGPRSITRAPTD